ncbi:MAG TPA: hypothetical protein VGF06_08295 [Terriglobales bacterium]|jgi:hypothetical protein
MRREWLGLASSLILLTGTAWAQKAPDIPSGTTIKVRTVDRLSSEEARVGDEFHATLEEPITVNDHELYPRGANVTGRVVDVHASGRLSEPGELDLVLKTVTSGARTSSLRVEPLVVKGQSHTKSNASKIGGGAALGAIIGAIAGGGKGAAVGTVVGAGAGTGAAAATGKKEIVIAPETVLSFVTSTGADVEGEMAPAEKPSVSSSGSSATSSSSSGSSDTPLISSDMPLFTARDRRVVRSCVAEHASDLPSDVTHRSNLPSGDERSLKPGGTVPDSISNKLQSLPLACVERLPKLPSDQERVIYDGRVLLINANNHILDMFDLEAQK